MKPTRPCVLLRLTLLSLLFGFVGEAAAQAPVTTSKDPAQWALIYSDVLAKNRDNLKPYTWIYRVEVKENNELLFVDHLDAHYGNDGRVATQRVAQDLKIKPRHGLLLKAGQEARLKDAETKIEFMKNAIGNYVYMTRGQVVDFFTKARKTEAVGYDNALRADAENVLVKGDSVTLIGDKSTAFPIYLAFSTPVDGKTSVRCEVYFRHLRQANAFYGPRVTGEFTQSGGKNLRIDVESYDYLAKP